ncbi:MAG TPA: hypothetical protein VF175_18900 [Lacipirellula sp.]
MSRRIVQSRGPQRELPSQNSHQHTASEMPEDGGELQMKMRRLEEELRQEKSEQAYRQLQQRVTDFIYIAVPRGSTVLIVSKGDDNLLEVPGRRCWHFPRAINGLYAGCYPADSREAIEHLQALQGEGAEYLTIPSPSYWWLEFYRGLTWHLEKRHRLVAFQEDACVVFKLQSRTKDDQFNRSAT